MRKGAFISPPNTNYDNYQYWTLGEENIYSHDVVDLVGGDGIDIDLSGKTITISSTSVGGIIDILYDDLVANI